MNFLGNSSMERAKTAEHRNARRVAAYALIGSLALAGCSENNNNDYLVEVPSLPDCELPDHQIIDESDPVERSIAQHESRNPVQQNDIVGLNFNETRKQLADFEQIHSSYLQDYGVTLSIFSNGELNVDDEYLGKTFRLIFDVEYDIPRLDATMECIEDAFASGRFEGREIRSYISADPRDCINSLQLGHRGVTPSGHRGECHATGGSVPWRIKEAGFINDIVILEPSLHPLVVAPGQVSRNDYPVEFATLDSDDPNYPRYNKDPNNRLLRIWIHEIAHTQRWMMGAEYSLLDPNVEEDLVKHIDRSTMSHINKLDDYQSPLTYTEDMISDWLE